MRCDPRITAADGNIMKSTWPNSLAAQLNPVHMDSFVVAGLLPIPVDLKNHHYHDMKWQVCVQKNRQTIWDQALATCHRFSWEALSHGCIWKAPFEENCAGCNGAQSKVRVATSTWHALLGSGFWPSNSLTVVQYCISQLVSFLNNYFENHWKYSRKAPAERCSTKWWLSIPIE